jgi:hypothetical protein
MSFVSAQLNRGEVMTGVAVQWRSDVGTSWVVGRCGGMISNADGGATWTVLERFGPVGADGGRIIEVPDGRLISMSEDYIVVSDDRGTSWRPGGPPLPHNPTGFTNSPYRDAFYAWRQHCGIAAGGNPELARASIRLDMDLGG